VALRVENIEINGETYSVRELSARELIPLMELASQEAEAGVTKPSYAEAVFQRAVTLDGATLSLDEIGGSAYLRLLPIAMRVNGMTAVAGDESGNA
jgi:hypothetical protein